MAQQAVQPILIKLYDGRQLYDIGAGRYGDSRNHC